MIGHWEVFGGAALVVATGIVVIAVVIIIALYVKGDVRAGFFSHPLSFEIEAKDKTSRRVRGRAGPEQDRSG
jgi:hypothetical protein